MADNQGPVGPSPIDWEILGPGAQGIASIIALLRLLATPPDPPARPAKAYQHPAEAAQFTFQGVYWALQDMGLFSPLSYLLAALAALVVLSGGMIGELLLWLFKNVLPEIAGAGLDYIDAFRKALDPQVAGIAVQVLNELLGTEFTEAHLPGGDDVEAHIARAKVIGDLFLNTIQQEISPGDDLELVDGQAGAARFAGMIVNFGVATALLGIAGELSSAGLFKDFRLIGEQVSSGLGLSKQMRIAIRPLMKTLVATPFQWQLNKQYHPARFTATEVVNPYAAAVMDHDLIVKDLELQGFDATHAEALIRLHQKRVTVADVELFARYGTISQENAIAMLKDLGYLEDVADLILKAEDLRRADSSVRKLIDEMETRVIAGELATEDFSTMLDNLPLGPIEKRFILDIAQFKKAAPHNHLTLAQAQKAFEEGIWTLDDLTNYLRARGYTEDDNATLQIETLLALAKITEAATAKQKRADAAAAKAAAKAAKTPPPAAP